VTIPELDWRALRSLHHAALERYCARVLDECAAVLRDTEASAHDRYLRLFALLRERDENVAAVFDDLRRSTAMQRLAGMIILGVVSDDELEPFTEATRESAKAVAAIMAPTAPRARS
jgi:hypothetical protein